MQQKSRWYIPSMAVVFFFGGKAEVRSNLCRKHVSHTFRCCWALLWTETGAKNPEDSLRREVRTTHARSSIGTGAACVKCHEDWRIGRGQSQMKTHIGTYPQVICCPPDCPVERSLLHGSRTSRGPCLRETMGGQMCGTTEG